MAGSWRKSSFSGPDSNCVEVVRSATRVGVRDSKRPSGPVLAFAPGGFDRLLSRVAQRPEA
jgi:Domain of unknown function (DUF397)